MTLIAISFHSTRISAVRALWNEQRRTKVIKSPLKSNEPAIRRGFEMYTGGTVVVFDWDQDQVVWQVDIDGAAGFCWYDDLIYINMLRFGEIVALDRYGREQRRLSHRHLNNLHTIVPTARGFLLTSTGTDSILELDRENVSLYEWCALDNGYDTLSNGQVRVLDRTLDQRYMHYPTQTHTTHVNSARYTDNDELFICATLFKQGEIISIDKKSGATRVLLDGLHSPHDLRPYPLGGWIVSDTGNNQTLVLDKQWQITRRIALGFNWVQSSAPLADGSIIIADTNNHRLVRVDGMNQQSYEVRTFPPDWRIYMVEEVPQTCADFLYNKIK